LGPRLVGDLMTVLYRRGLVANQRSFENTHQWPDVVPDVARFDLERVELDEPRRPVLSKPCGKNVNKEI